jgi:hypothetical protein
MQKKTVMRARPALEKVCGIKDCATGKWKYEFYFSQADGTRGRVIVPGDDANKPTKLLDHLNGNGATWDSSAARKELVENAIAAKPIKIVYQLAKAGWQIEGDKPLWFCFGKRMVGTPQGAVTFAPPGAMSRSRAGGFVESGTLAEWKSRIAIKATFSTSLTVCMSAALAAVLVRPSGLQNFTLHLFGGTRAGKTSSLLAAMSFYGMGHEDKLKNWNSSGAVELIEAAAGFNDCVFPLNEVGSRKGKRALTYEVLRDLYAQYAEGGDRDRHSSWEAAHGGQAKRFRGICFATAEHSVADYAKKAGDARDGGELFRAIDVIAVRGGMKTIFDLGPDDLDQRQCLQDLHDDLERYHGTAAPRFIDFLTQMGAGKVKARVKSLMKTFVGHMPAAPHNGVARQLAMNYGLLYAGAILGIESGILPWTKDHLQRAMKLGFEDALEYCKVVDPLTMGLEILKAKLRDKVIERKTGSAFGVKHCPGYWSRIGGQRIEVIHTRQFGAWFADKRQRDLVLDWLAKKGAFPAAAGGLVTPASLKGVCRRWPGGSLVRSFVFVDAFPVAVPRQKLVIKPIKLGIKNKSPTKRPIASKPSGALDLGAWPVETTTGRVNGLSDAVGVRPKKHRPR